ncbi:hypothetical protein P691DRAFT_779414 [Macrolepiota fuliginosa MF-IS2]|uniref:FHA domain-containing protein n=1 Tax=Macrolepiota fuliginosa MF-IS2 TaxID=1400762 RepID=A0A9P5X0D2_9AGAR|nr:hypothetical protein P691DRAFT_779414 [Macrolepiota fuliginosa MF-IS2]
MSSRVPGSSTDLTPRARLAAPSLACLVPSSIDVAVDQLDTQSSLSRPTGFPRIPPQQHFFSQPAPALHIPAAAQQQQQAHAQAQAQTQQQPQAQAGTQPQTSHITQAALSLAGLSPSAIAAATAGTTTAAMNPPGTNHAQATTTSDNNPTGTATHRIRLVPHLDTRRSLRFDPIGRDLREGDPALRIGRFTDRSGLGLSAINSLNSNKLAFRSKVVSRAHAEIWTFLNHVRLSAADMESRPFQIKDGDILQLGVDYQGGAEDIYKSVKIKVEIGREWQAGVNVFNTTAFKNLKVLAGPVQNASGVPNAWKIKTLGIPDCCVWQR